MENFPPFHSNRSSTFDSNIFDLAFKDFITNLDFEIDNISFCSSENFINNNCNMAVPEYFLIPQEKVELLNFECCRGKSKEAENESEKIIDKNTKEFIQRQIKEKIYSKRPFKEKNKKLGRKIKSDECSGEHNKFSDDNILRKIKNAIMINVIAFINQRIMTLYSYKEKEELKDMKLFKLKQKNIENSRAEYNKQLLNKTLKEILSGEVSNKYKLHSPQHNKDLIERLINDKDKNKSNYFITLFQLTFMDCLNHFRGSIIIDELKGMKQFDEYYRQQKPGNNNDMYKKVMKYCLINYEKEIMEKKERNRRKKINQTKE